MSKMRVYAKFGLKVFKVLDAIEGFILLPLEDKWHCGLRHPALIKRGIAFSMDILIVLSLMAIALYLGGLFNVHPFLIISLTACIGMPLYFVVTTALMSRTFGKLACDIQVNIRGNKNKWMTITLRELLRGVSAIILPVTILIALASKTNNTLHDAFAGTYLTVEPTKED